MLSSRTLSNPFNELKRAKITVICGEGVILKTTDLLVLIAPPGALLYEFYCFR